jgi:hypothetical protein
MITSLSHHRRLKRCPAVVGEGEEPLARKVSELERELARMKLLLVVPQTAAIVPVATTPPLTLNDNRDQSTHTTHNTINVHIHGEEDTSHLKAVLGELLDSLPPKTNGKVVLTKVAMKIYADPEYPQNITTYIPNKRDNIPHVWTKSGWEPRTEAEVYPAMVNRACDELQRKQDFELGYTPDGLVQLGVRSLHVRAAFDAETEAKDLKEAVHLFRPMLQGNKHHLSAP